MMVRSAALIVALAQGIADDGYVHLSTASTNMLADICASSSGHPRAANFCTGYVMGVFDRMSFTGDVCPPEGFSTSQGLAIARKYLADHPERWSDHPSVVVGEAFRKAFPCRARKKALGE